MISLKDSGVIFDEAAHRYWLDGKELRGVTSTLVARAFPHTYDGVDEETLRRAAERGSAIHKAIEAYEEKDTFCDIPEFMSYVTIKEEHRLSHVASEYLITDGERYASAIDHVFTAEDGGIVLADIKTTYDKHYDKVACQLSIYRRFFERLNPGLKVARIALIWLRGDKSEYRELSPWADEVLDTLFAADAAGDTFDIATTYGDLPAVFAKVEDEVARLEIAVKAAQERQKELKQGLYDLMEAHNVKSFTGSRVRLTRVLPSETTSFDSKALKADHPDLYEKYVRKSKRAGSLKITISSNGN